MSLLTISESLKNRTKKRGPKRGLNLFKSMKDLGYWNVHVMSFESVCSAQDVRNVAWVMSVLLWL